MEVTTNSARAVASQKMVLELLLSDIPETSCTLNSELDLWARRSWESVQALLWGQTSAGPGHLCTWQIAANLDACIQCGRWRAPAARNRSTT